MRRIFVDTNVLIDVLERREPFFLYSANILNLGATGDMIIYASALSVVNCIYVSRKVVGYGKAVEYISLMRTFLNIAPMGQDEMYSALDMDTGDVEDALQYRVALSAGCDAIITRNEKHFAFSTIPIYTPETFLKTL